MSYKNWLRTRALAGRDGSCEPSREATESRPHAAGACLLAVVLSALAGCDDGGPDEAGPPSSCALDGGCDAGSLDAGAYLGVDASISDASVGREAAVSAPGFIGNLPKTFSPPKVPADNPMTKEKIELGRHIFYDERLSDNQTFSCASCHKQELAFTDGMPVGVGSTGEHHTRGSMSLANVVYAATLTWANPLMTELERQLNAPIFGDQPIELGMKSIDEVEQRFRAVPRYAELFRAAFPGEDQPVTMTNLARALASFERSLISSDSPFDRWQAGDSSAISESAKRGYGLFNSEKLECFHCHGGFDFTDHVVVADDPFQSLPPFHNTGLYDVDGLGGYPEPNTGAFNVTMKRQDMGKFKAPTLRNIAITAPYMHDGSIATLSDVLDHYARGGRKRNPITTDPLLIGFTLSDQERADAIAFLESLTDRTFLTNPAFSDPGPL